MVQKILDKFVYLVEIVVAAVLVILSVLLLFSLISSVVAYITPDFAFGRTEFLAMISIVLEVFILVELFRIAIAYMNHENVVPTVLEAALVAVARKIVILEPKGDFLSYSIALGVLLIAVSLSWFLLARSKAKTKITERKLEQMAQAGQEHESEPRMSHEDCSLNEA